MALPWRGRRVVAVPCVAGGRVAVAWRGSYRPPSVSGAHIVMCVSAPVPCELQGEGGDPRAERSHAAPPPCPLLPNPRSRVWSGSFPAGGQGLLLGVFSSLGPGAPGLDPQMCGR